MKENDLLEVEFGFSLWVIVAMQYGLTHASRTSIRKRLSANG